MDPYSPDHPKRFADDSAEYAVTILRWAFNVGLALVVGLAALLFFAE